MSTLRSMATVLATVITISGASATLADPSQNMQEEFRHVCLSYEVNPLPKAYGKMTYGNGPEADINELYFIKPFPDPATLSHEEIYMLTGLKSGPRRDGRVRSWRSEVFDLVHAYYMRHGVVPEVLTPEVITELAGEQNVANLQYHFLKNPLTGAYPRLNAREFSPGEVYIRPLTAEEIRHFCDHDSMLDQLVNNKSLRDWEGNDRAALLLGRVFYMRVYGRSGVIGNTIEFFFAPVQ